MAAAPPARSPNPARAGRARDWSDAIGLVCLALSLAVTAYLLLPELLSRAPAINDHVFHELNLGLAIDAMANGRDPTDAWQPWVGQGYPVFHYYQHLPYIIPGAISLVTGLSLLDVFKATNFLLLVLFPASVFWAGRRVGLTRLTAGTSAVVSTALSTNGLFGFDLASYVWAGHGLYTQLWGMVLLPPAVAEGYRALRDGRGYFLAVVLIAASALSHLAYGYIAILSLLLFVFLEPQFTEVRRRAGRALVVLGFTALSTAYFWVPLLLDRGYLNRSVWETDVKYDSFGAPTILGWLFRGELFDYGRFPVVTLLIGVGLVVCALRWREPRSRILAVLFVFWLLLYFGRPVWGAVLDLTPLSEDFFLHRLIGGVHMAGIFLAGIGLALPLAWLTGGHRLFRAIGAALLLALILLPIYGERLGYLRFNDSLMARTDAAVASEQRDLNELTLTLKGLPPGRVYAGLAGQWGAGYRMADAPMYAFLASAGFDTLRLYHSWSLAGDVAALFDERRLDEYNLFNVRYVVAPPDHDFPEFVRLLASFGRHRLYEVETTGFMDVVSTPVAFLGDKSAFFAAASAWLSTDAVAAKENPAVYFESDRIPQDLPALPIQAAQNYFGSGATVMPSAGVITGQSGSTDTFAADVVLTRSAVVMLKMTYHPGWQAWVDGVRADTFMLLPGYVGVSVQAGTHRVELKYTATPLRYALMGIGTAGLALLALGELRRRDVGQLLSKMRHWGSFAESRVAKRQKKRISAHKAGGAIRGRLRRELNWMMARPLAALAVIVALGLLIRLSLLPLYAYLPGDALDEFAWMRWMGTISDHGVLNIFRETRTDYVAYHWVLAALSTLYDALGGAYLEFPPQAGQYQAFPFGLHLLMKVPSLVFDGALIVCAYAATATLVRHAASHAGQWRTLERKLALLAAAIVAIQPAIIYDSAVWAQIDAAGAAAMLASIALASTGRSRWAWSIWAIGFLIKPQSFVILPVLVLLTVWKSGWRSLVTSAALSAVVAAAVLGPWIVHGDLEAIVGIYQRNFQGGLYSGSLSLAAWNVWWFGTPGSLPLAADAGLPWLSVLTPRNLGLILSVLAMGVAVIHVWRDRTFKAALVSGSYLTLAFFMLPTGVHERYLYPFLVLLLPVVLIDRRWIWIYAWASLSVFLNLIIVAPPIHDWSGRWYQSGISFVVAAGNIGLLLTATHALLRQPIADLRQRLTERPPSLSAPSLALRLGIPRAETPALADEFDRDGTAVWESDLPHDLLEEMEPPEVTPGKAATRPGWWQLLGDGAGLVVVFAASILAGSPLLSGRWMSGHDSLVYVPRSVEFFEVLKSGTYFPRWAPDLAWGHGEPTFNFNPPLINYATSALHAVGFNFIAAENLAILGLLVTAGVGMFLLAREFFGGHGGVVAGVGYVFAPYVLSRLYVSHALADFSAFAFIPFAFWGLYRFCDRGQQRFLVVGSVSGALILLSSSPAALMTFPALILLVATLWWTQRKTAVIYRGGWCIALALALAAFFWMPSLVETEFVHIARRVERLDYKDHFVSAWQLIYSPWGFGTSRAGPDDGMSFSIGPLYLLAAGGGLLFWKRIWAVSRPAGMAVLLALAMSGVAVLMTLELSRPIWDLLSVLHPLQFPFRFLQLVALGTTFLLGFPFVLLGASRSRLATALMVVLVVGLVGLGLPHASPQTYLELTDADFSPRNIAANGIPASAREFEPIWVAEFPATPASEPTLTFVGGAGRVTASGNAPTSQIFAVNVAQDSLLRSSTFYFPGWTLYVDGVERAVAPSSPSGLMAFYLEAGSHVVLLRFEDTHVRVWSTFLSIAALFLLILSASGATNWLPGPIGPFLRVARMGWSRVRR